MKFRFGIRSLRVLAPGLLIALSAQAQQASSVSTEPARQESQEIAALKAQLAEQQRQLEQLKAAIEKQQAALDTASKNAQAALDQHTAPASLGEVASASPTPVIPNIINKNPASIAAQTQQPGKGESPLSFEIGGARFSPLGFVDVIDVERSTNTGNILGTSFGGVPYSNSVAGQLAENRFSMQNSRIGMRIDSVYKGINVLGYLETDFLGNAANGIFVTSNSDVLRLRLFFVDLRKDQWEILGGQSWSMMTPNRVGISPLPSDIFYSQNVDTNYQAGLIWARQTGIRAVWHPSTNVAWGFAVESSDQYVPTDTVLPSKLSSNYGGVQFDNSSNNTTPTLTPDFITKVAFDGHAAGHAAHLELAGVLSTFRDYNSVTNKHDGFITGGGAINANIELVPHFRLISNNFFTSGDGRYIANTGVPDVALRPNGLAAQVRAGSTVDGIEVQATPKLLLYSYYGGTYALKETFQDAGSTSFVGYGVTNTTSANRAIQEATVGFVNNFWKNPQYGALSLNLQFSYITRSPWAVTTAGQPNKADLYMGYIDFRYTLP